MIFKKELPAQKKLDGRHGLGIEIPGGTETGARKIADSIFKAGASELAVESIHNPNGNIWIFLWPSGSSVQMPAILKFISKRLFGVCQAFTLKDYLKHIEDEKSKK